MLRNTHIVVGISAALILARPDSIPACLRISLAASCGAVISDIDADQSKARREADIMLSLFVIAFAAFFAIERVLGIDLTAQLMMETQASHKAVADAIFVGLCAFGKLQSHRTFMHSLLCGALLSICLGMILPKRDVLAFSSAFLTHLALDSLNYKPIYLFWPLDIPVKFSICTSDGLVNRILAAAGSVSAFILFDAYSGIHFCEVLESIAGARM